MVSEGALPEARIIGNTAGRPVPGRPAAWLFVLQRLGSVFLPRPLYLGKATSRVFYLNPCAILAPWEAWFCGYVVERRLHGLPGHALARGHSIKFQKQQKNMHLRWT